MEKKKPLNDKKVHTGSFPARLCALMEDQNIGTVELARILYITPSAVSGYKSGKRSPDLRTLTRLCEVLHTSSDYLLGLSNCPHPQNLPCYSNSEKQLLHDLHSLDAESQNAVQALVFRLKISDKNHI